VSERCNVGFNLGHESFFIDVVGMWDDFESSFIGFCGMAPWWGQVWVELFMGCTGEFAISRRVVDLALLILEFEFFGHLASGGGRVG